jgi:hypothetical protein
MKTKTARLTTMARLTLALLLAFTGVAMLSQPASAWVTPTIGITTVVTDVSVTIQGYSFPAGQTFTVRMGAYGTYAIGGTVVGTTDSGAGGSFAATYSIPASLAGSNRIAIRLDSPAGYYAYNWFYNNTVPVTPSTPVYTGIPTIAIATVERDVSVGISAANFPPGQSFTATMGPYGSQGIGGIVVGTYDSGSGGSFTATYSIPAALAGSDRIAIRLQTASGYYFAYNWFWNNSTTSSGSSSGSGSVPASYYGYPYFSIAAVVSNSTVTIQGYNFPPSQTFTIQMGPYGSYGYGTVVTTFDSGAGGSFSATYTVPGGLAGLDRIALRMDSNLGYFAYNWFWNNTTTP